MGVGSRRPGDRRREPSPSNITEDLAEVVAGGLLAAARAFRFGHLRADSVGYVSRFTHDAVLAGCLLLSAGLTALLTWWLGPFNQIYGRFVPQSFDFEGIVPLGYMLFAVALAVLAGTLLRRSIPAMVVTLVGFTSIR